MNSNVFSQIPAELLPVVALIGLWTLVIKGLALYRAGSLKQKGWFIALLLINTVGILELVYLLGVSKRKSSTKSK